MLEQVVGRRTVVRVSTASNVPYGRLDNSQRAARREFPAPPAYTVAGEL